MQTLLVEAPEHGGPLDSVFSIVTLPNLRYLSLDTIYAQPRDDWPFLDSRVLLDFLGRIRDGRLESLDLESYGMDESTLVACLCLPQMSAVTKLYVGLRSCNITERTISLLTPDGKGTPLLPRLRVMCLRYCMTKQDGWVAKMLRMRDAYGTGIAHAEVLFEYDNGNEHWHWHEQDEEALKAHK